MRDKKKLSETESEREREGERQRVINKCKHFPGDKEMKSL